MEKDGERVDTLGAGRFLGASAFLDRGGDFKAPVTARALEPVRVIAWPFAELEPLFARNVDLEVAIEASLGLELTRFLEAARSRA